MEKNMERGEQNNPGKVHTDTVGDTDMLNNTGHLTGTLPYPDSQPLAGKLAVRNGWRYILEITELMVFGETYGDPEERKRMIDDMNA